MSTLVVKPLRAALVGNPNTGKTTVFNALTGFRARVGNYAGVTVERKTGPLKNAPADAPVELIDLPGTYSVAARSADEMVAVEVLLGHRRDEARPDLVLIVLDASNLERNLFLATQVLECGLPCAFILNMMDVAREQGMTVDAAALAERFGVPVFPVVAAKGEGIDAVRKFLASSEGRSLEAPARVELFPEVFAQQVQKLRAAAIEAGCANEHCEPYLLRRALLEANGMAEERLREAGGHEVGRALEDARNDLQAQGLKLLTLEARVRYAHIRRSLEGVLTRPAERTVSTSDKIDAILIHKVWGTAIFAVLMVLIFQAIFAWAGPFMDLIDGGFSSLGEWVGAKLPEGPLQSFVQDGVIAGVGGVLVFLPQIVILFFFIAVLEDCGYIARAAFLMDRLLSKIGLSGRSFIPMLSSFACAIPGIMATRTIEDRRDRFTTILIAPLMSCSARIPVYTLFIAAFIPETKVLGFLNLQGLVLFAMYLVGVVVAVPVALILKKTLLKGSTPAFMMELPPYRTPQWKAVFHRLVERAGAFVKRAGTIIFAISVIIWALTYYPRPESLAAEIQESHAAELAAAETQGEEAAAEVQDEIDRAIAGAYVRQSFLGRAGHLIEPVVRPLGWDWKIGMAAIASFPAREVIISTLGIIYDLGGDTDEESDELKTTVQSAAYEDGSKVYSVPVALSIMVFFALCAQCAATLAVIKRETNSWRWPIFSFTYMTVLAYIAALLTYQLGSWLIG